MSPVSGQSKVYGSADPNFSYTSSGVVIGVTPKFWNASGQLV
ncbi:MBG domain-containing protein, partial [Vibrio parahaemolyticus]